VEEALSGRATRNRNKARGSETGTGYRQNPRNVNKPKQGELPAQISKRTKHEGGAPQRRSDYINTRESRGPGDTNRR
jgi:hypothetical protein